MQNLRPGHILDVIKGLYQSGHIMAVNRPEIAYVQPLEDVLFMSQQRLERVVEP